MSFGPFDFTHLNFDVVQVDDHRNYYEHVSRDSHQYHRPVDLLQWGSPPVEPNSDPPDFLPTPQAQSSLFGIESGESPTEGLADVDPLFNGQQLFDFGCDLSLDHSTETSDHLESLFYPSPEETPNLALEFSETPEFSFIDDLANFEANQSPELGDSTFLSASEGTTLDHELSQALGFPLDFDAPLFDRIGPQPGAFDANAPLFPPVDDLKYEHSTQPIFTVDPLTAAPCAVTLSIEEYTRLLKAATASNTDKVAEVSASAPKPPSTSPKAGRKTGASKPRAEKPRAERTPVTVPTRTKEHVCPAFGCDKAFWRKDAPPPAHEK